jgi:GNAT superfamily N-acetyltransferase
LTVRPGTVDEVEELARVGLHFCQAGIFPMLEAATEETLIGLLLGVFALGDDGLVRVVEDRPGVVLAGLIAAVLPQPITQIPCANELALWVEEAARGTNAGRLLMDEYERWVDARGLGAMMVAPAKEPWARVGLAYQRRGYVPIETVFYRAPRPKG